MDALSNDRVHTETELLLRGYRLILARIFYRLPDHPLILNEYIWQDYDVAPQFPKLNGFIQFWREKIDGQLHSVQFNDKLLTAPHEWRTVTGQFLIH